MEESTFVKHLPWIIKIGTSLNINTEEFNKYIIACRFLTGAALFILTIQNIDFAVSGDGKYAKTHDLLIILIMTLSQATFIKGKKETLVVVKYLLEPPFHSSKLIPGELSRRFSRFVSIFGVVISGLFTSTVIWAFTPLLSFVTYETNSALTFHFPFHWIPGCSESYTVVILVAATTVLYLLSGVIHFYTQYPIIAYCALKIKIMVELLTLDVELLDDKADQLSRASFSIIVASRRLPFCERCRNPPKPTTTRSLVDEEELVPGKVIKLWKFDSRECCEAECRENLKEFYVNESIDRIVDMHVDIIRFVGLVDKTFQLSLLMYNQFAVFTAILLVPWVNDVQSLTGSEIIVMAFEVVGALFFVGIFNYCGQMVLNGSEEIRSALGSYKWYDKSFSTRRRVLIMLTAATRPLRLTYYGTHTISNETYLKILSAAYTYASVLQSLKAGGK